MGWETGAAASGRKPTTHLVSARSDAGRCGCQPSEQLELTPRYRLTFRASARTPNLARVIGVSGFACEREGSNTAKITTPAEPQGVQLTDHLEDIWPSKGDRLAEHLELAFRHSLHLIPET